jgi:hypothetical protein
VSLVLRLIGPLVAVVSVAPPESPGQVLVMDAPVSDAYVNANAEFAVNREAGRVWVEAAVDNGGEGEVWDHQTLRSKVDGLSYDALTGDIVYTEGEARVLCAKVVKSKFLFISWSRIKRTGACKLIPRFESIVHDNGFEREKRKHLLVELSVVR